MITHEIDLAFRNNGSIWFCTPLTEAARDWVDANVQIEDWAWMGASFAIDQHLVENLVRGAQEDGLVCHG